MPKVSSEKKSNNVHKSMWYNVIRTVPPFVTAHTFCASRYSPRNSYFLMKLPTDSN